MELSATRISEQLSALSVGRCDEEELDTGVGKRSRCEDPKLLSIMTSGTELMQWVVQEVAGVDLWDMQMERRLVKTTALFTKKPDALLGTYLCQGCAASKPTSSPINYADEPSGHCSMIGLANREIGA